MRQNACPPGWYPVARLKALGRSAKPAQLANVPLLAWRGPDGGVHLKNRTSGLDWPCTGAEGFLFAPSAEDAGPFLEPAAMLAGPHLTTTTDGIVKARLGDVAENILDTTHTSVVHSGYLRRPDARRTVGAHVTAGKNWISATYPPGAAPAGWGARLIGAHRHTIRDTFRLPAVAEVLYTNAAHPVFAARFRLAPRSGTETYVAATVAVPGRGIAAAAKLAALRLFFLRIFAEDRAILELIGTDREPLTYAPQDLLRPGIDALLEGRSLPAPGARATLRV